MLQEWILNIQCKELHNTHQECTSNNLQFKVFSQDNKIFLKTTLIHKDSQPISEDKWFQFNQFTNRWTQFLNLNLKQFQSILLTKKKRLKIRVLKLLLFSKEEIGATHAKQTLQDWLLKKRLQSRSFSALFFTSSLDGIPSLSSCLIVKILSLHVKDVEEEIDLEYILYI